MYTNCSSHKHNLANNIGGDWQWVLGTLFYKGAGFERGGNWPHKRQVFHFLFSVYFIFHYSIQ
jgi:hypothetical protein